MRSVFLALLIWLCGVAVVIGMKCPDIQKGVCETEGLYAGCRVDRKTGDYDCDPEQTCQTFVSMTTKSEGATCNKDICCCKSDHEYCSIFFFIDEERTLEEKKKKKQTIFNVANRQRCHVETYLGGEGSCHDKWCYMFSVAGKTQGKMELNCMSTIFTTTFDKIKKEGDTKATNLLEGRTCPELAKDQEIKDEFCVDIKEGEVEGRICCCSNGVEDCNRFQAYDKKMPDRPGKNAAASLMKSFINKVIAFVVLFAALL